MLFRELDPWIVGTVLDHDDMPFESFGYAFFRVDRALVQEFHTKTEGCDVLEPSLITTENSKVARLDTQVLDDCAGDLLKLLLGFKGRVECIPDLLEDAHTADAGIQTRLEACLEIIKNFQVSKKKTEDKWKTYMYNEFTEFTPKLEGISNALLRGCINYTKWLIFTNDKSVIKEIY